MHAHIITILYSQGVCTWQRLQMVSFLVTWSVNSRAPAFILLTFIIHQAAIMVSCLSLFSFSFSFLLYFFFFYFLHLSLILSIFFHYAYFLLFYVSSPCIFHIFAFQIFKIFFFTHMSLFISFLFFLHIFLKYWFLFFICFYSSMIDIFPFSSYTRYLSPKVFSQFEYHQNQSRGPYYLPPKIYSRIIQLSPGNNPQVCLRVLFIPRS